MFMPTVVDDYSHRRNGVGLADQCCAAYTRLINVPGAIGSVCSTSCWTLVLSIPIFFTTSPPTQRSSRLSKRNNP